MNFNTGEGLLRVNPSCDKHHCTRPAPLHHQSFFHRHGIASIVKWNIWDAGGSSDFSAHLHVSLVNPIVLGAPAISDRIYFGALEPMGTDPRFRISMTRDRFPSLEIYHDLRRTTTTLCRSRERHPGDLFPVHRNASSCDFQRIG
jgi:hypothetical protein